MDIVIYHNPGCGTSRNTLALIRHAGHRPHVIDYQLCPPDRALLAEMIARSGLSVRDTLRVKGTPHDELGLGDPSLTDDQLLDAMVAHPILINRPLVVTPLGVKLCRPSDMVLDVLPDGPLADYVKPDGEPCLSDRPIGGDDADFRAALAAADLPTGDLEDGNGRFFAYSSLSGTPIGYGGFELLGKDALIRSIVVAPEQRGRGYGKAMAFRLSRRAFDAGARRSWLLTTSAADYFATLGFKPVDRADAPAAVLATRQAQSLCPASATLMSRKIAL